MPSVCPYFSHDPVAIRAADATKPDARYASKALSYMHYRYL